MFITSNITFQNIGGTYTLKEVSYIDGRSIYRKIAKSEWPTDIVKYENYVISADSDSHIVPIYPDHLRESKSLALEFAAINIKNINEILDFCNRYGLPDDPRFLHKHYNDYIFTGMTPTESLLNASLDIPFNPHVEICMGLYDIASEIMDMRNFVVLLSALEDKNYTSIAEYIMFSAFAESRHTWFSCSSALESIRYIYIDEISVFPESRSVDANGKILRFIEGVETDTIETELEPKYFGDYSYPQHKHLLWQNIFRFTKTLLKQYKILDFTPEKRVVFDKDLNFDTIFSEDYSEDDFIVLTQAIIIDAINAKIWESTPELTLIDGQLVPNWSFSSLTQAMYTELFFKINPYNRIKKCANPSCNGYFTLSKDNSRKIYCSNSCAQLMAKRKQRSREKQSFKITHP